MRRERQGPDDDRYGGRSMGRSAGDRAGRGGVLLIAAGTALSIASATFLLILASSLGSPLPSGGIVRLSYNWLVIYNMEFLGLYLAIIGGGLLMRSALRRAGKHVAASRLVLAGAAVAAMGQALYIIPGDPQIASVLGIQQDDLFNAVGSAVSLIGASLLFVGIILSLRQDRRP